MAIAVFTKDPAAILDYEIDWSDWLTGDTIAPSTEHPVPSIWSAPAGIVIELDSYTAQTTTVRLSGGEHGTDYEILNHVFTASGQSDERSILIQVRQVEAGANRDATDRAKALTVLMEWAQIEVAPVLEQSDIEAILDRCKRASTWTSLTAYNPGNVILPTVRTGHRYRCVVGGTSGATEPFTGSVVTWPTTAGAKVYDGTTLVWQEDGPEYRSLYDLRQAAYECWDLKTRKATQFIQAGDLNMQMVYSHCKEQRDSFTPMGFA